MAFMKRMKDRTAPVTNRSRAVGLRAGAIAAAIAISGCAVAPPPIAHTPNVVATPQRGQLAVSVAAAPTVGEVTPVYVSIANGNDAGERVAPLPPGEAARQAGSAKELEGAMQSAAVSGVGGAAVGAAAGAVAGAAGSAGGWGFRSPGTGALVGSAFGGGMGIIRGVEKGQSRADQQANQQIEALSLKPEEVRKDFTVSGYVFFPKGQYSQIEILLFVRETGDTEDLREPWH